MTPDTELLNDLLSDLECVACWRCHGTGEHECPDGPGLEDCEECEGNGYLPMEGDA